MTSPAEKYLKVALYLNSIPEDSGLYLQALACVLALYPITAIILHDVPLRIQENRIENDVLTSETAYSRIYMYV